LAKENEKVVIH